MLSTVIIENEWEKYSLAIACCKFVRFESYVSVMVNYAMSICLPGLLCVHILIVRFICQRIAFKLLFTIFIIVSDFFK